MLTENTILVYKLNDSHPEIFEILNLYDNCEYEKVLSEIEKWNVDVTLSRCIDLLNSAAENILDLAGNIGSFLGQRGLWTPK